MEEYWTDKFNNLPYEARNAACAVGIYNQINGLKREKDRLKRRYRQSLNEINGHIKSLQRSLRTDFAAKEPE